MNWAFYFQGNFFWCFLCDFVILCLLQMKSFPSFLTSCEVGKTSGRSPARLGLIIISTNFDQIYRTLCHQTVASHWKKKNPHFYFCFVFNMFCNINLSELGLSFIMKQVQKCPLMDLTQKTNFWDGLFWLLYVLSPCFFAGSNMGQEFTKNGSKEFDWLVHCQIKIWKWEWILQTIIFSLTS